MAAVSARTRSRLIRALIVALLAALSFSVTLAEAYGQSSARAGTAVIKTAPRKPPHTVYRPSGPSIASISRRSLASSDDIQRNINTLLQIAVQERRIDDIEALVLRQRYSTIPGRGDFALLECLKVRTCDLRKFSDLAAQVGNNQLHLLHAARCIDCNKINIYKLSGNTTEELMHSYYGRGGWKRLEGEIGSSGIDGLYYKTRPSGGVSEVLVTEAKFNESILQETTSGTQLSKEWILANLERLRGQAIRQGQRELADQYAQISRFVEHDVYRAQLWRINIDDDRLFIWRERVSSKGRTVARDPIHGVPPWNPGTVHVIDMLEPGSNFDQQIVNDFRLIVSRAAGIPSR